MSVYRQTPLSKGPARGRLLVTEVVAEQTRRHLQQSVGGDGRRHEGIVLWAGRSAGPDTIVAAAVAVAAEHGRGFVHTPEAAVGVAARAARAHGLAVLAQVHSHPGTETRHSDGDDRLVLMPYEGMFSLVVGRYGDGALHPAQGAGLHQFQDGRWVLIDPVDTSFVVVPAVIVP
jgi:proteasome lid subunit RPN8/RPN11